MVAPVDWFQRYVRDTAFLQRYPFYAGVLAQLNFVATESVEVMAVRWRRGAFELLVNESFFAARPRFAPGVLLHEVHHLVLGHLSRREFFDVAEPDMMQLAMEVSANEYITEMLPSPIVWQQFRELGLQPHQTTRQRYELLVAQRAYVEPKLVRTLFDDHGGKGRAHGIGIHDVLTGRALPNGAGAALHHVLRRARQPRPPTPTTLPPLRRGGALAVTAAAARMLKPTDPDGLLGRDVDAVIAEFAPLSGPPRVDWRTALRSFVGGDPGADWSRPNRRQPHRMLEVPGRSWRVRNPEVLVAIDTSGSMGPGELGAVSRELTGLARHARLTIVECDDAVQRIYPFRGAIEHVLGCGGTDLCPPFAPELVRRYGRGGVVYFTDGLGPWPARTPPVPVLWVLAGAEPFDCPFGHRVRLEVQPGDGDGIPEHGDIPF